MDDVSARWKSILENVKGIVNTPTFKTWFEPIKPISLKKNTLTVSVNSPFAKEWLESRYLDLLTKSTPKSNKPII